MQSQNGYSCPTNVASRKLLLKSYQVPGTRSETVTLRRGSAATCLLYVAARWNAEIEPLAGKPSDEWGYAERDIRGSSTEISNHASGTAMDLNAAEHPLGTRTLGPAKLAKLQRILDTRVGGIRVGDVIRCGAFYTGRPDEMHEELNAHPAAVKALAKAINALAKPKPEETDVPTDITYGGTTPLHCPAGKSTAITWYRGKLGYRPSTVLSGKVEVSVVASVGATLSSPVSGRLNFEEFDPHTLEFKGGIGKSEPFNGDTIITIDRALRMHPNRLLRCVITPDQDVDVLARNTTQLVFGS